MPATLRIGEVAQLTGTTPRTIRYYEEIGLLPPAEGRQPGSHRLYEEPDVERLREVLRLKDVLGVSLEELSELVEAESARAELRREWRGGAGGPERRREILSQAVEHIDRQLELIRGRRDEIARLEEELVARKRRVRARLRELDREPQKASA
jgi:MerR family transcriptional regulator, repressor of the yfmOP operon